LGEVPSGLGEVLGGLGEVPSGPYAQASGRDRAAGVSGDLTDLVPRRREPAAAGGLGGAVVAPRESAEVVKPAPTVLGGPTYLVASPVRPATGLRGLAAASVALSNEPRAVSRRPDQLAALPGELFGRPGAVLARRWRLAGAWLAVLAGGCAAGSGLTEPLRLAADLPHPQLPTRWLPVAAGAVLVALGLVTTTRPLGSTIRPVLAVALVTVPMVAGEPLGELLDVLGLDGVAAGPALGLLLAAVALVVTSAVCLVLAGGFDRDDADLTPAPYEGPLAAAGAASAVLTIPAFWLPLLDGAGWGVTGVLQPPLGLGSWGLLAAFAVLAGTLLVVPRCRAPRAFALLGGTAVVLSCRLARPVLTPGRLPDGGLGAGFWASALCLVVVLVTAVLTVRARPSPVLSSVQEACAGREQEEVWR
jgi:hypothetical protein